MLCDWSKGELGPALVTDGSGRPWTELFWLDTETGHGEKLARDVETGTVLLETSRGPLKRIAVKLPRPIRVEFER